MKWDSLFPENPIKMDDIKKYPNNSAVYCLDETIREDLDKLIDKGNGLFEKVLDNGQKDSG